MTAMFIEGGMLAAALFASSSTTAYQLDGFMRPTPVYIDEELLVHEGRPLVIDTPEGQIVICTYGDFEDVEPVNGRPAKICVPVLAPNPKPTTSEKAPQKK